MKRVNSLAGFLLPHLHDILFVVIFYFTILLGSNLFRDGDPGRHITIGKYILENRTIPMHDLFSYTMYGQPLTPHEWLAQLIYGAGYYFLGLNGVVLIAAVLIALTAVLIYREIKRRTNSLILSFVFSLLAISTTMIHWLARPHLFTFLYVALWTPRLSRLARGEKVPQWQFPLIMLLWANTHGAFIAGFVIWAAFIIEILWSRLSHSAKTDRKIFHGLLMAGGASFLATFFNPAGWRLWITSAGYITNRYLVDLTSEYRSADFHQPGAWPFVIMIMLGIFIFSRSWKKLPIAESLLFTGWMFLGIYSARNIPLFAIVSGPILADSPQMLVFKFPTFQWIEQKLSNLEHHLRGSLWPLASILVIGALLASGCKLDGQKQGYHFNTKEFPVDAGDWLDNNPQSGNMFNYFPWGGYLIYRFWPEQRVFIDGQLDFYGEDFTMKYEQILLAVDGWQTLMVNFGIAWVLIPPNEPLALVLQLDPAWKNIYEDSTAVIFRIR